MAGLLSIYYLFKCDSFPRGHPGCFFCTSSTFLLLKIHQCHHSSASVSRVISHRCSCSGWMALSLRLPEEFFWQNIVHLSSHILFYFFTDPPKARHHTCLIHPSTCGRWCCCRPRDSSHTHIFTR